MICPDFDLFPKLKEPLHGKQFKSLETMNAAMNPCIRNLIQADNLMLKKITRVLGSCHKA
jgi:hypothetical protein